MLAKFAGGQILSLPDAPKGRAETSAWLIHPVQEVIHLMLHEEKVYFAT